jgi:hypothetical protein
VETVGRQAGFRQQGRKLHTETSQQAGQPHHGPDPHRPARVAGSPRRLAAAGQDFRQCHASMIALLAQNIMASRHAVWQTPASTFVL